MRSLHWFSVLTIGGIAGLMGGLVANSLLSGGTTFASGPETLSAQKFQVVDGAGKVRGSLAVEGDGGTVSLTLFSSKSGEPRAVISAGADGMTSVGLVHQGKLRAQMKIAAEGTPTIELWDPNGTPVFMAPKNTGTTNTPM